MLILLCVSLFYPLVPFVSTLTLFRLTPLFPESHFLKRLFSKPQSTNSLHFSRLYPFSQRDVLFTNFTLASKQQAFALGLSLSHQLARSPVRTHALTHSLTHLQSIQAL